jgi:RNA polymerase sigma-70 factor, ECF subfamily
VRSISENGPGPLDESDHSLMRRLRLGSEGAATQIYLRYGHRLRALARAQSSPELARLIDPDEIVQSVFGSFFRGARKGYYDVPVGAELWRLFLVIALNKIRAKWAYHQAAKRAARMTVNGGALERCPAVENNDAAAFACLKLTIDEALLALPDGHRDLVLLRMEGFSVAEISERLRCSRRTVERMLQNARKRLSRWLDEA